MSDPYCNEGQKRFNSLTFLQSIYNDPSEAKSLRMRAAIEALLFEFPKLAVTAQLNSETCAAAMERATRRSAKAIEQPKAIEPEGTSRLCLSQTQRLLRYLSYHAVIAPHHFATTCRRLIGVACAN